MSNFIDRLKNGELLICDGATGTELQKMGLKPGECPERWNWIYDDASRNRAAKVRQIHLSYLEAGADIILTNTFGGNRLKLKACGEEGLVEILNKEGIRRAKEAVLAYNTANQISGSTSKSVYILGDVGPTGQIMESSGGTLKFEEAEEVFEEQIRFFFEESPSDLIIDGIIFETFEDIEEIKAGILAARKIQAEKNIFFPIIASMTFHPGARGFRTIMGVDVQQAVNELEISGADIIGTNCGNGPAEILQIIKEMHQYTKLPLIAEPNAGAPALKEGKTVFPMGPEEFAKFGLELKEAGANIIGGCCGTTPLHIKKLVSFLS